MNHFRNVEKIKSTNSRPSSGNLWQVLIRQTINVGPATPQVRLNRIYQILPKSTRNLVDFIFSTFLKSTIIYLSLITCLLLPATASALISSGFGKTNTEAIAEAKRNAVETSLSQWISPAEYKKKQESLNKNFFMEINKFLEDYEILVEKKEKGGVRVTINVEVKTAKLKRALTEKEGWIASYEENYRLALFLKKSSRSHLSGNSREARYAHSEFKGILENEYGYEIIRNSLMESNRKTSRSSRRSRSRTRKMEMDDALEMAADMGAGYAVLFDLKIDKKRQRGGQRVSCLMTLSVYDTQNNRKVDSYEIEGDAEPSSSSRGRSREPSEAVLDAIYSVAEQAAIKVHSIISPNMASIPKRPIRYEVILKNFKNGDITSLKKEFEFMEGFSRLREVKKTARTYKTEIHAALNRTAFLEAVKNIFDKGDYKYNLNFDRNKIFISKYRTKEGGEEGTGYVDL